MIHPVSCAGDWPTSMSAGFTVAVDDALSQIGCIVTLPADATIVVCAAVVYFVTLILKPKFVK